MTLHHGNYLDLLLHPAWKRKREAILTRDGHACRHCGARTGLQVHHRQYHRCARTGHKLAPWCYADQYLITLCATCHTAGHRIHRIPRFTI